MRSTILFACAMVLAADAQVYTRGVGVYPGDPREDFSPAMRVDAATYRNLALRRPAYQSSAYDYNLTAQLVTDGIRDTHEPRWIVTSTSQNGILPKHERESLLDDNWVTAVDLRGRSVWVQFEVNGGDGPAEIDRLDVEGSVRGMEPDNEEWTCILSSSGDGQAWTELGRSSGMAHPTGEIRASIALGAPARSRFYRVTFESGRPLEWHIGELHFRDRGRRADFGGPYNFTSAWMSAGTGEEWIYVDLGAACTFDRVALAWIRRPAEGEMQVSDDARAWRTLQPLGPGDDIQLPAPARGRYVRVFMTRPESGDRYVLSELEVYGRGGPVPVPKAAPQPGADGRVQLSGGSWRVQRDALVNADGATLSQPAFDDSSWLPATVPATVLSSYWNAGALPDPNYGDNQLAISDSFFYADFWYRDVFVPGPVLPGRHVWLNFDGVNWKADVFLNGEMVGRVEGGFLRGRFDVMKLLRPGEKNVLAVRIEKNATPGSVKQKTYQSSGTNGGALGADNPTYHAAIGWDWIPTIRGRDTGIWSDVYLTTTGSVSIESPWVDTMLPLPDTSAADVTIQATLNNSDSSPVNGTLNGRFGDTAFALPVSIDGSSRKTVETKLHLSNPKLWWPNGYGAANLYDVQLRFETGGAVSDTKEFRAGVRQFTYSEDGGALRIWINGRRFVARGGNWGFGESMLRYRAREYDAAVRYHRDMNFTMIRNWVGQIGDDAFYDACDRWGIVVWQDFWLANPWDGPDPDNPDMFLRNAEDFVRLIRSHPSVGLYVGRNEGYPPDPLERGIRRLLADLHPGIHYIPSSADDVVSGHGPYQAMPPQFYFAQRATTKLHSELGMPNIVTMDSLRQMMPESAMWPQGEVWGLHDFTLHGAQGGESFNKRIEKSYGGAKNAAEWIELAQFVNYEGYRAMFEAQSKNRMGLLIWMSHPCWPSFVWQTYDYYFDPTAGYFGAKKGSEPLHIQWNPLTNDVEVVNYSAGNVPGLMASAEVRNMDGGIAWTKSVRIDSADDSVQSPIRLEFAPGLTPVHFIRLRLTRGADVLSDNFYWRGAEEGSFTALRNLPPVALQAATRAERVGDRWRLTTTLRNPPANAPALMVRVKAVREKTGDRILPALYSDNYVAVMPGEERVVVTDLADADTRGERPRIVIEGFNLR
ncbi:MAG TPA: discoidin domain-containing protein [Bryobacteraceae bacterium]|nr:discoidin domain-containing protein [Bryobacteraceae bacterium]